MYRYQIINYKSLQLYAYELSVDYEPSLNTTIRQNTKMLKNKVEVLGLSQEMFFGFL